MAARYDLAPPGLMTWLRDGAAVHGSRIASLDWQEDAELEHLLARAAHLDRAGIRALRPIVEVQPKPALWYRQLLAWCPVCACEDVTRHGEIYERAVWRLGCCAACPTHRLLLADVCPVCAFGRVGLQAVAGRQRLVCVLCKRLVDALPDSGRGMGIFVHRWNRPALVQCPDWTHLALALQTVLLGVAVGSASTPPWPFGVPVNRVAIVVRDLAAACLWPDWPRLGSTRDKSTTAAVRDQVFAVLTPRSAYDVLGIIASVLTAVAGGSPLRMLTGQIEGVTPRGAAIDLAWFIRRLPAEEQRWLRAKAKGWGPVLARVVADGVGGAEASRRRAIVTRERARGDAAWLRHATAKYANDARRRIAARAAKREGGRTQAEAGLCNGKGLRR
jgi:hypothetical protein